jgi:predicted SprT family Zn-dependent metalloprotease
MNTDIAANKLKVYLQRIVGREISLILTDNTSSMISVRLEKNVLIVRLQRIFLTADSAIHDEIASFIINRKAKIPQTTFFIRENSNNINPLKTKKVINLRILGRYHNLSEIYNHINETYFEDSISSKITWGRKPVRKRVRVRRLGSYNRITNIITINPILDSIKVPLYYLQYIVYHEMLHAHIGMKKSGSRYLSHTREFREQEKCFIDYKKAVDWQKNKFTGSYQAAFK